MSTPSNTSPDSSSAAQQPAASADAAQPALSFADSMRAWLDLRHLPAGYWVVVIVFAIASMAYFGVLTLMQSYLTRDLGWKDSTASMTVSTFTGLVTLFMLGAGSLAEMAGVRRGIIACLCFCVAGRFVYCYAPEIGGVGAGVLIFGGLLVVALGEAAFQPATYAAIKLYSDARTSSMGYGLVYAIMNLGIVGIGALSAWVRPGVQAILDARGTAQPIHDPLLGPLAAISGSGIQAVNWVCFGITVFSLLAFAVLMTRRVEAQQVRPDFSHAKRAADARPWATKLYAYFAEGPFTNPRFIFFIFILLPVRTLFAHQWLTMPEYILRAYDKAIGDRMEWLVNWINPAIIFLGVPIITALTRRVSIFTMILVGTLVSAASTFLLVGGPSLTMLLAYFFLFSIGEALWSARFLEYASELAPEGRIAQYMGLANIPWLLAKFTTGFYSGYMLATFCPRDVPVADLHTGQMWFIYGCIAMISPLGLWLARGWVKAGLHPGKPQR